MGWEGKIYLGVLGSVRLLVVEDGLGSWVGAGGVGAWGGVVVSGRLGREPAA